MNSKLKAYASVNLDTGLIQVNPKKNKNKKEFKDSVYHELYHLAYPKASERKVRLLAKKALNNK